MKSPSEQSGLEPGRLEFGRITSGALLAAAFAACLTIASGTIPGALAHRAMYVIGAGMPFLALHIIVTEPLQLRRHHIYSVMEWLPVFAAIAVVIGFAMLFESAVSRSGVIFATASVAAGLIGILSQDRAARRKHQLKISSTESRRSDQDKAA